MISTVLAMLPVAALFVLAWWEQPERVRHRADRDSIRAHENMRRALR